MLSISLFAEEVRKPCTLYKHSVPTAHLCPNSFERLLLRQSRAARTSEWRQRLSGLQQRLSHHELARCAPHLELKRRRWRSSRGDAGRPERHPAVFPEMIFAMARSQSASRRTLVPVGRALRSTRRSGRRFFQNQFQDQLRYFPWPLRVDSQHERFRANR